MTYLTEGTMATGNMQYTPLMTETVVASGGITKRRFVGHDGAQISAEGNRARGVSLFDVSDGYAGTLITRGTALVEAAGAVAVGDAVGADESGKGKKAADILVDVGGTLTPGDQVIQVVNGYAREAAADAGDVFEVHLV